MRYYKAAMIIVCVFCFCFKGIGQAPDREEFLRVCDSLGVHHGEVVWAQAVLESGNFRSGSYLRSRNCLGIYDSRRRRYRSFGSWRECLVAYRDCVQYRCKESGCSYEEYLRWLVRIGYAADSGYINKLRRIMYGKRSK